MGEPSIPPAILNAAIAMAGGPEFWNSMGPEIRAQYVGWAETAAPILLGGGPVSWTIVELTIRTALAGCRGILTERKADSVTLDRVARRLVDQLQLCRYTVLAGPPTPGHKTQFGSE